MNGKLKKALSLFLTFFKIGAFTFGGGYAMIPLIQKEVVDEKKWITDDDILEEIKSLDIGNLTPIDALNILYKLQGKLNNRYKS